MDWLMVFASGAFELEDLSGSTDVDGLQSRKLASYSLEWGIADLNKKFVQGSVQKSDGKNVISVLHYEAYSEW